jgi:hypothetical protein
MKHTLSPLHELAGEAWWLMRQNFGRMAKLILPRYFVPTVLIAITLCAAPATDKGTVLLLLFLETLIFFILLLITAPEIAEIALSAAFGDPEWFGNTEVWPYFGTSVLMVLPGTLVRSVLGMIAKPLGFLGGFVNYYLTIRLSIAPYVRVAEGGVWFAAKRAWRLTEGVSFRLVLYSLAFTVPTVIVTVILLLPIELSLIGDIKSLHPPTLQSILPLIGGVVFAVLPGLLFVNFFMPFFHALIYDELAGQELIDEEPVEELTLGSP